MWRSLALALLGLSLAHAATQRVLLVDSKSGTGYLKRGATGKISKESLGGVVAGLSGLVPAHEIDAEGAEQIGAVLAENPLKKPRAHVSFNVAGLSEEDVLAVFDGRQTVPADLSDEAHIADIVMDTLGDLASANPDVTVVVLDQAAVQGCNVGEDCVLQHLDGVAQAVGGTRGEGSLVLGDGVELNLHQLSDSLLTNELASLFAGVNAQVATANKRAEAGTPLEDVQMMEMTMLGLQGLSDQESAKRAASKQAVAKALAWAVTQLDSAFGGEVTYQVAAFDAPLTNGAAEGVEGAISWKQSARSRRLQTYTSVYPDVDEESQARVFSAKAAGYGSFILLLYFLLAGAYCMCNMPFKRDTLLYGSKKEQ